MDGVRRGRDAGSASSDLVGKRARLEAVAEYAESLRELTFSSKPIINSLTMIADENRLDAPQIAEAINMRILQLPADSRLPVIYLMDSIVKNVREPYTTIFTQYADNIFIDTYRRAQLPETLRALLHLLATWRTVFPPSVLGAIDHFLLSVPPPVQPPPPPPPVVVLPPYAAPAPPTLPAWIHGVQAPPVYAAPVAVPVLPLAPAAPPIDPRAVPVPVPVPAPSPNVCVAPVVRVPSPAAFYPASTAPAPVAPAVDRAALEAAKLYDSAAVQCPECGLRHRDPIALAQHRAEHESEAQRRASAQQWSRGWLPAADTWVAKAVKFSEVNTLEALNRQYQVASTDPMPAAATEPSAAPASVVPVSTAPLPSTMPTAAGAVPELPAEDLERARASMVPADPRRSTCSICGESFERTYDDVHDQWVYRGVTEMPDHTFAHMRCWLLSRH